MQMEQQTSDKLKEIKRSFRLYMNGMTAASMRKKGVDYHLNWGVSAMDLQRMANNIGKDDKLALELWKENIRECKILAAMIMPPEKMLPEIVDVWLEQDLPQELAEALTFYLFQHLDFAPVLAYQWMAADREFLRLCGFLLISRLFANKMTPDERGINEYLDQVQAALSDPSAVVRNNAAKSIHWFAELGEEYKYMAKKALSNSPVDVM